MEKQKQKYSAYQIVGELLTMDQYRFVDGKLISAIVTDAVKLLNEMERSEK